MSDVGSYPIIPKNGGTGVINPNTTSITLTGAVNGYVLTSDAAGNGTWKPVSTSGSVTTLEADDATTATPSLGVITVSGGSTGLTTTASASTLDITGTLNVAHGGTGALTLTGVLTGNGTSAITANAVTQHGVVIGGASNAVGTTSVGATGTILQGNTGADPTYSTATYPSTTTVSQILYSSSANVVAGLATANNGVLITGTTGIPSILADGTTGQVLTATTGSPPSWVSPATSGTVTTVSVVTANGFAGTVANATTTPAITLTTSQTGLLSGNGTAITGTAITQYNVITAGASNAPNSVAPSATSGVPLISQGSSAQPIFGTAVVAGGGTGVVTMTTAYAPVCAGTTATGALQVASTGLSNSGYILTSTGSSSLPSFQAPAASSITITGDSGGGLTGNSFTFTGGTTGLTFSGATTTETLTGTLVVANGGTGAATHTAYAVLCGGTTTTAALQSIASVGTAGQVLTSNGASALPTFQGSGLVVTVTELNHASSTYVVLSTDYFLSCDTSGGVLTINFPNAPSTGRVYVIKDKTGSALTSNITLTTVGGSVTLDGATSYVMNANYQSVSLLFNGTVYEIF